MDGKQAAIYFAESFCDLLDKHRGRLAAYLADNAILDWFGRTISGKENIAGFINREVPQTVHNLTSIEPSGPIQHRKKTFVEPMEDDDLNPLVFGTKEILLDKDGKLAMPLGYGEVPSSDSDDMADISLESLSFRENGNEKGLVEPWKSQFTTPLSCEVSAAPKLYNSKLEEGQGDGFHIANVNTSTKANKFLEARGSIQFQRVKQPKATVKNMKLLSDTMKWDRFCKLQIAYSGPDLVFRNHDHDYELPAEFKIWLLVYQDNTRCRRNLAEAFDKVK